MIALLAASQSVASYVVCDTSKVLALEGKIPAETDRPSGEIWPDAPAGVGVLNRYFEQTPLELFAGVVTERGLLEADRVRGIASPLHPEIIRALGPG
jgi:translation initiation factor 2B subunit (eIF-2B alpha/beta/delta family)